MKTDDILEKYSKEIAPEGRVLDIGCGEGRNALWLAERGFEVTAVDKNESILNALREKFSESDKHLKIEFKNQDIKEFKSPSDYYNVILAFNSLMFLKKSEFLETISKIKNYLAPEGLIFLSLFTKDDPSFSAFSKSQKPVETDTFFNEKTGGYWQFMEKGELLKIFSDFETLLHEEEIIHDVKPAPHDHGMVFYVGKKKARSN